MLILSMQWMYKTVLSARRKEFGVRYIISRKQMVTRSDAGVAGVGRTEKEMVERSDK
ncbi:uncharacterized protein ANIA_11505 [Aspergillus nidulans FGSC A4]|uniref:Uncharacterized protein n=1 Tax=Emericella nidulans (strain FGSC A4 / ATCC 38163 / CBS 112.46 / NRRL 194 / M139) TaxID=227321 RepID=C8V1K2_EMENI|nr:hypothetical protein [Aspergillus nidulans FGSC A4]CBF69871.1 TPA: hypothetical protein ANIA_11505 [Aspergillus nidulans FGSC A4]